MLEGILDALIEKHSIEVINVLVKENYYSHIKHPKIVFKEIKKWRFNIISLILNTDLLIWGGGTCLYEGNDEELKKLIEERAVDVMVSVGPNFFYTVTLPCTLWFLDRKKRGTDFFKRR